MIIIDGLPYYKKPEIDKLQLENKAPHFNMMSHSNYQIKDNYYWMNIYKHAFFHNLRIAFEGNKNIRLNSFDLLNKSIRCNMNHIKLKYC